MELADSCERPVVRMGDSGNCRSLRAFAGPCVPMLSDDVMPPLPVCDIRMGASYDMFRPSDFCFASVLGCNDTVALASDPTPTKVDSGAFTRDAL